MTPIGGIISVLNDDAGAISAIATIAVAAFTLTLWRSTDKLWRAGERQLKIAQAATDAATRQAQLMVNIELPIFVIEEAHTLSGSPRRGIEIKLGNHGRTPAIIVSECLEIRASKSLSDVPEYTAENTFTQLRDRVVDRGHGYSIIGFNPVSEDLWRSFHNGQTNLWAYGYIEYLDFMKELHREGFCIIFSPARETRAEKLYDTMPANSTTWARIGNPEYTYNRVIR